MDKIKRVYTMATVGLLAASIISCGGKKSAEEPSDTETAADAPVLTSKVEEGDVPGAFVVGDDLIDVVVIAREPQAETHRVKLVYTGYFLAETDAKEILSELDPRLSVAGREPVSYTRFESLASLSFGETKGEMLALVFPGGPGTCIFSVATTGGRVSIDMADGSMGCRLSKKVRPGIKVNLREEPSTEAEIIKVLVPGDVIFPTGEKTLFLAAIDPDTTERYVFQRVITSDWATGWVVDDDGVFEFDGYVETLP
ncbi:MAG: SH3 domain-containing protein [Candidatus Coatesbacteria bacterium]|nr:MAG: SH3 domain-containing protein [Candidatus Coatesbacteria bacterium]